MTMSLLCLLSVGAIWLFAGDDSEESVSPIHAKNSVTDKNISPMPTARLQSNVKVSSDRMLELSHTQDSIRLPIDPSVNAPSADQFANARHGVGLNPNLPTTIRSSVDSTSNVSANKNLGQAIALEDAKGAVDALYQAILWREPDSAGGGKAVERFTEEGWSTYIENAGFMIQSVEFGNRIIPTHSTEAIISRLYGIFLGRCPSRAELRAHYESLRTNEPGQITTKVLHQARETNIKQIFAGGYKPETCTRAGDDLQGRL